MGQVATETGAGRPLRHHIGGTRETPVHEITLGTPVVHGATIEQIFSDAQPAGRAGLFRLWRSDDYLIGSAAVPITGTAEPASRRAYGELLDLIGTDHHLCRIWNYVPDINAPGPDGMEVYQSFCRGRSLAFESKWGRDFKQRLPAASAVGSIDERLVLIFAASNRVPRHFENPHQVPAYDYPREYGPRPPSFARASVCRLANGLDDVFISGTSAVRGHHTVAPGDTLSQTTCTLENLRDISIASGLGELCGLDRAEVAYVKTYLRVPTELPLVESMFRERFDRPNTTVCFVHANVCRAALSIEIEVTARGVRPLG